MKCNPKKLYKSTSNRAETRSVAIKNSTFIINKFSVTGGIFLKKSDFDIIIDKFCAKLLKKSLFLHKKQEKNHFFYFY